jgi:hypothetical protein
MYLNVWLKDTASFLLLSRHSFWTNSASYEYKNKSANIGALKKLIRYQFWCTRCAFRLLKSLQWCSGRKRWKSEKVKTVKEPSDENQTECHEIEPNPSKDRATCLPEGYNPSFWDEYIKFTFFLYTYSKASTKALISLSYTYLIMMKSCPRLSLCHLLHDFYAPEIKDRGAYCFCPVCHSVILSETLTLPITLWNVMLLNGMY